MDRRALAIALASTLVGCCAPVSPTLKEVKTWVSTDLPPGSSEAQVQRFCVAHDFAYSSGPDWGNAARRVGGCESLRPVVWMQIAYDKGRSVKSINVYGGSMLP